MKDGEVEFKDNGDFFEMFAERDTHPFDDILIGELRKGDDGYFRFYPEKKVAMTCKQLNILTKKVSELNARSVIISAPSHYKHDEIEHIKYTISRSKVKNKAFTISELAVDDCSIGVHTSVIENELGYKL